MLLHLYYHIISLLKLASRCPNFFEIDYQSAINLAWLRLRAVMDLVIAVILSNCAIAIVLLLITIGMIRLRRQVVGLTSFFERWMSECQVLSIETPRSIVTIRSQICQLRQIYSQQLLLLDQIRTLRSVAGISRSMLIKRDMRRG